VRPQVSEIEYSTQRKLSATNRLLVGFIVGALFALVPMYYFYLGREAALGGANPAHDQVFTAAAEPVRSSGEPARTARNGEKPFASQLTYELSQLPEEPLPTVVKAAPAATAARSSAAPAAAPEASPLAARVVNARPISALPPEPRDRTAAIEKEAQKPEYRETARRETPAAAPHARVFAGREVELKAPQLPDMPRRPIVASASDMRAEIEAERARSAAHVGPPKPAGNASAEKSAGARSVVPPGPYVPGVTPITRARESPPRQEVLVKAKTTSAPLGTESAAPAAADSSEPGGTVEKHLAVTREWLAAAAQTTHTLQLMGTSSEEQLREHLKSLTKILEPGRIHVFRTMAHGKPSISVVYGEFADRKSALQALEKLPPAIVLNRPVLRTVNGIRAEMKQHKTDG